MKVMTTRIDECQGEDAAVMHQRAFQFITLKDSPLLICPLGVGHDPVAAAAQVGAQPQLIAGQNPAGARPDGHEVLEPRMRSVNCGAVNTAASSAESPPRQWHPTSGPAVTSSRRLADTPQNGRLAR